MNRLEIVEKIITKVSNKSGIVPTEISLDSLLTNMGVDSLDCAEIIVDTEDEFGIRVPDNRLFTFHSVGALVDIVENSLNSGNMNNFRTQ